VTITRIGPIAVGTWHEPSSVEISGASGAMGGQPISASFVLASRTDIERLVSLVNNDRRRRRIGDAFGVLEWVEADGALARWRGFWVLEDAKMSIAARQHRRTADSAYAPVGFDATFFGAGRLPVIAATHRERVDDFTLAGQALVAPLYPALRVETAGTLLTRVGDGLSLELRKGSDKRAPLRLDAAKWDPDLVGLRPALTDPADVVHYGPAAFGDAEDFRLETPFVRVTIGGSPAGHWLVEGWVAGAWVALGAVRIRRTVAATPHEWTIARADFKDDEISLVLANDYDATTVRVTIVQGELGMRLVAGASYYVQWLNPDDSAAPAAAAAANYIEDTAILASGARRLIALVNTPLASTPASFEARIDTGQTALVGFVPAAPQADDTAAEQGKQLLFERDEILTLE
jgi:hypothetical protein